MSKKQNILQPECTIAKLGIYLMLMKSLQDNPTMLLMFFFILGVEQDVISEHHDKLVQLWLEHQIHQVDETNRSISKQK
jgi:hypothetical protein